MIKCGGAHLFCPQGVESPRSVRVGYYTTPAVASLVNERTSESITEAGFYSDEGVRKSCPPGTYGASLGLASEMCDGPCSAGAFCPEGSTSSTQEPCGWDDSCENGCSDHIPEKYYCKVDEDSGLGVRIEIADGDGSVYTVPIEEDEDASLALCKQGVKARCPKRTGTKPCPSDAICTNGQKRVSMFQA
jgi:hypothetical protein